ncbi:MAG: helix-turn-helix domain-containing protein [Sedimenticola sp.]
MSESDKRETYNLWPETGEILGLSKLATYNAARRGEIPTIRIGKRILVPKKALERLLDSAG